LGKVIEKSPHNPKGNRENPDIMRLNESVLVYSGGSWDRPPQVVMWKPGQVLDRDRILKSYLQQSSKFAFKDPRTLFTLPFWTSSGLPTKYVGTFRHPMSAARSLNARDRIPIPEGLALWKEYNSRLALYWSIHRFPIISFDVTPVHYRSSIDQVASYLNLNAQPGNVSPFFFDHSLRRQTPDETGTLPAEIVGLYERLNGICREQGP